MSEYIAEVRNLPAAAAVLKVIGDRLGDEEALIGAFGRLHPETQVFEQGNDQIALDLWADGQPYASVLMFKTASPKGTTAILSYGDQDIFVTSFAAEAAKWVEIKVGPLATQTSEPDLPVMTASSGTRLVTLSRIASGEESQFDIAFSTID